MRVIHKQLVRDEVNIPLGSQIIDFKGKDGIFMYFWYIFNREQEETIHIRLKILATGQDIDDDFLYIKTCHTEDNFVWHLFGKQI